MKLVLASNNQHKIREIQQIFAPYFNPIVSMRDAGIEIEIEETGQTFEENARIKASEIQKMLPDCAVLADDSGLEVDALSGAPGVYSARFAGEPCNDKNNNDKLLELLRDVPQEKRACRFVSCIALYLPGEPPLLSRGTCEGKVGFTEKGSNGFGYDPLFIVRGGNRTFAELTAEEKNQISHRARALDAMHTLMQEKERDTNAKTN